MVTKCEGCGKIRALWNGTPLSLGGVTVINLAATATQNKVLLLFPAFRATQTGTLKIEAFYAGSPTKPVKIDAVGIGKS